MDRITAQEARARGLTRYFTGQPCVRSHVAERHTSSNACVVCAGLFARARRKTRAYKDRLNAKLKAERTAARELRSCATCYCAFDIAEGARWSAQTCSPECSEIFIRENQRRAQRKRPDRECAACLAPFVARAAEQVACSDECRAALRTKIKPCIRCTEEFTVVGNGHNGFCSDTCRATHQVEQRAAYHQKLRREKPELIRSRRQNYEIVNAEAHRRTTRNVNAKRIEREVTALAVARDMIPDTLKNTKGRKAKIKASLEFLQSIGVNHPPQPEKNHATV